MAELIWRADTPNEEGVIAEYRSHGAVVKIKASESATPAPEVPEWVLVARDLMAKRAKEYLEKAGKLPSPELFQRFDAEMAKRLDAFIEDPRRHPFQPMGLYEFEQEQAHM